MGAADDVGVRLGVAYVAAFEPEGLAAAAAAADSASLDEFWLWEDCFTHGGIATAATSLAFTENITVGIGLLPVPLRNVALTAMELASLHRIFPGRFKAGVGHGVQTWMDQVGARVESPMTLLREYQDVLRRLLAGENVEFDGRYLHVHEVALDYPPLSPVALMLGGKGPKSLRLAAHFGDGTLLDAGQGVAEIRQACDIVRDERDKCRPERGGHHEIAALLIAATGDGAERRVHDEVRRWNPEPSLDVGVAGGADQIATAVEELTECGVTSVVIQPTQDEPDLHGFIHFLGRDVKPLVATVPAGSR